MAGWSEQPATKQMSSEPGFTNVRVVETQAAFHDSIADLLKSDELAINGQRELRDHHQVGPGNPPPKYAVMQISSWQTCYIYRLFSLRKKLQSSDWQTLALKLILNGDIRKIGYKVDGLMRMLAMQAPGMRELMTKATRPKIIDLQILEKKVSEECPQAFDACNPRGQYVVKGFAELVQSCLHRVLDRAQQRTPWQQDVLTSEQLDYAGEEVYRMLQLMKTMKLIVSVRRLDIDVEESVVLSGILGHQQRARSGSRDRSRDTYVPSGGSTIPGTRTSDTGQSHSHRRRHSSAGSDSGMPDIKPNMLNHRPKKALAAPNPDTLDIDPDFLAQALEKRLKDLNLDNSKALGLKIAGLLLADDDDVEQGAAAKGHQPPKGPAARGHQPPRGICHHFATSRGCHRDNCPFEHSRDGSATREICRDFQRPTGCPRGQRCFHLHEPDTRPPCYDFNSEKGCTRLRCKFRHVKMSNTPKQSKASSHECPPDNDDACKKLKEKIKQEGYLVQTSNAMLTYQVSLSRQPYTSSGMGQKWHFGQPIPGKMEKVVMVVGATGAGKSTLINSLLNSVLGVKYTDDYRFQLIQEKYAANQAISQTQIISAYTLHHQDGFQIPYTLTIIDTPGFGDTTGIERDKMITQELRSFFEGSGADRIDHIDAIGFVAQSALARLTPTQKYIFDSILSVFGKDIGENFCLLVTFADTREPSVLSAVKEADITYTSYYKFNNSAVFNDNKTGDVIDEKMWENNMFQFSTFFSDIGKIPSKSLVLTKEVLEERGKLELYVTQIQLDIQSALNKLEQLTVEKDMMRRHRASIERNKNFTYEVQEDSVRKDPTPVGQHTTTCLTCNRTCHENCIYGNDEDKRDCWAMLHGSCRICPGKCDWQMHKNVPYLLVMERKTVRKTSDQLKRHYEHAKGKHLSATQLVKAIADEVIKVQEKVLVKVGEVRKILMRLQEIALKPNPLSELDYIDILIDAEQNEAHPGWQKRVEQLQAVRKRATHVHDMSKPNYDPFEAYRKLHTLDEDEDIYT